ncbi:unnamed protein product [Caenorhabditis nigoni]
MSADNVMNYAPIIWLVGVMIFGAIINFVNYYKSKKRQKELDRLTLTQQKQPDPDTVSLTAPPDYSTALSMLHKPPPQPARVNNE